MILAPGTFARLGLLLSFAVILQISALSQIGPLGGHADLVALVRALSALNRSLRRRGMIHAGDRVVRAFAAVGWEWGGRWSSPKDYQHFSANGH